MGSTPTLVTADPVVQRRRRLRDMQESAGSIPAGITREKWSVGVPAAHVCGKDGDRVRLPDGPLDNRRAGMPLGATDPCKVGVMGSTPMRSTENTNGLMVQREDTALAWRKSGFNSRSVHCNETSSNPIRW